MRSIVLLILPVFFITGLQAQNNRYRQTATLENRLLRTELAVRFDYENAVLNGTACLTLQPYFYETDSLVLDAKEMVIEKVALTSGKMQRALTFKYDGKRLVIQLDKRYRAKEKYSLAVTYRTTNSNKGLYFINRDQKTANKPVQVWTDGEPEFTSYWCPTIDRPNQKGTLAIEMTVPNKYITLSNGTKVRTQENTNDTRTDFWSMDQPLSPYLFFMCVGEFSEIKDRYRNIPVNYYIEKKYENAAKQIFGNTPEMIRLYEKLTGVRFPWPKYAQVVVRDFTSTAMENTSITAHGEAAQQDVRELADWNRWENNIAHELFHQWFGDYVTCESWSNLSLNESFASYGTYLWREYKYGPDAADGGLYDDMQAYLGRRREHTRNLVRFYYDDPDDMFDDVSYQKGGCILHMLRKYVGDSAFFKSLHLYLESNKHGTAEAHQLRLAFEQVTGKDLNGFFNQWFYGSGHPVVEIKYNYNAVEKKISVVIEQKQPQLFSFPLTIDVYDSSSKKSYKVWASVAKDTFTFSSAANPHIVNVDADKCMLWEKKDNKTLQAYIDLYYEKTGNYVDRLEAVKECLTNTGFTYALSLLQQAMRDRSPDIRLTVVQGLSSRWDNLSQSLKTILKPSLLSLAATDSSALIRAKAIELTGTYLDNSNKSLFVKATGDVSYSVAGAALASLAMIDAPAALTIAEKQLGTEMKRSLLTAVLTVIFRYGGQQDFTDVFALYSTMPQTGYKMSVTVPFVKYLARINNENHVRQAIDQILVMKNASPTAYQTAINDALKNLSFQKALQKQQDLSEYIESKLSK